MREREPKEKKPESLKLGATKMVVRNIPLITGTNLGLLVGISRLQEGNSPAGIAGLTGGVILGTVLGIKSFRAGQRLRKNNEL